MSIATKNTITNSKKLLKKMNNSSNNLLQNNNRNLNNNNNSSNNNNINFISNNLNSSSNFKVLNNNLSSSVLNNMNSKNLSNNMVSASNNNIFSDMRIEKSANNVEVKHVLVLYTGGTIGMVRTSESDGLVPIPNMFEKTVRSFPNLHDDAFELTRFGKDEKSQPLVLPEMENQSSRVAYSMKEYDPLLDSSNMTMDDWIFIANDIKANYDKYDGFVVLHGTDTLAYTASALSFMFENLGKSVIVTGSQIPLFEARSDGRDNFLGALIMAGHYVIPEVCVYFGHKLFRGNRTSKVSSDRLNAFDSPNLAPLATLGINIEINKKLRLNLNFSPPRPLELTTSLNTNVSILKLYPSITASTVRHFLQPPMAGVVLQTYGAGNFPTKRSDLLEELEKASGRGVIIINCTQCNHGTVSAIYETGKKTESVGVIPGIDMTCEAALTKLAYVLGRNDWSLDTKREMMRRNLRGELTGEIFRPPANSSEKKSINTQLNETNLEQLSNGGYENLNQQRPAPVYSRVRNSDSETIDIEMIEDKNNNNSFVVNNGVIRRGSLWNIATIMLMFQFLLLCSLAIVF